MKKYYLIEVTINEYNTEYVCINDTLEEAKSKIMDYANWYCDKGCCDIVEVDERFNKLRSYQYWKGELYSIDGNRLNLGRHK